MFVFTVNGLYLPLHPPLDNIQVQYCQKYLREYFHVRYFKDSNYCAIYRKSCKGTSHDVSVIFFVLFSHLISDHAPRKYLQFFKSDIVGYVFPADRTMTSAARSPFGRRLLENAQRRRRITQL